MTPRLPSVTPRKAVRALERCGWVVVPMHARDLAKGTLAQIIDSSGVSRDDFLRSL